MGLGGALAFYRSIGPRLSGRIAFVSVALALAVAHGIRGPRRARG